MSINMEATPSTGLLQDKEVEYQSDQRNVKFKFLGFIVFVVVMIIVCIVWAGSVDADSVNFFRII